MLGLGGSDFLFTFEPAGLGGARDTRYRWSIYSYSSPMGSVGCGMLGLGGSDFLFTFEPAGLSGTRDARFRWFRFSIHIRARWARWGAGCSVAMVQIFYSHSSPLGSAGRGIRGVGGSDFLCTFEPVGLGGARDTRYRWCIYSHSSPLGSAGRGMLGLGGSDFLFTFEPAGLGGARDTRYRWSIYSHSSPLGSVGCGMLGFGGSDFLFIFEPVGRGAARDARFRWFRFSIHIRARWAQRDAGCSV